MDAFLRQTSPAGQFASQGQQAPQHRPQGSQGGPSISQGQTSQQGNPYSQGNGAQATTPFPQAQGLQQPGSYPQSHAHGQNQNPGSKTSPGDQRAPSISKRRYIKWSMVTQDGNDEDTETLVLTEPKTGLFVDVRLLRSTLQNVSPGKHAQIEPSEIDWAFSGNTVSTPLGPDKAPYHRQVVFKHWVDSRSLTPEEVVDNAYMFRPNDGTDDEIEVGSMVNPHTGDKQGYEERWSEEDISPAVGQDSRLCIVMTTEQNDGTRGTVIVVGQWSQAIMRTGQGTLHIERWFSSAGSASAPSQNRASSHPGQRESSVYPSPQLSTISGPEDKTSGWQLIARVGVPVLPSPASFINQNLSEGMICSVSGMQWRVRAVREW